MYIKFDQNGWAEKIDTGAHSDRETEALRNVYWIEAENFKLYKLVDGTPRRQTNALRDAYDVEQYELRIQSSADSMTEATAGEITDASLIVDPTETISQQLIANPLFSVYSDAIIFDDPRVVEVMEQLGEETVNALKRQISIKRGV